MQFVMAWERDVKQKNTYDKWRDNLMKMMLVSVGILFVVEIVMYFFLSSGGFMEMTAGAYIIRYIWNPLVFNLSTWGISYELVRRGHFSWRVKNYILLTCLALICFCVAYVHSFFVVTTCVFSLPIILSGIFADNRLTRYTLALCCGFLLLSGLMPRYDITSRDGMFWYNMAITTVYLCITSLFTGRINTFNTEMVRNLRESRRQIQNVEQELLLDHLTGLYNHTGFYQLLEAQMRACQEKERPLSLVVIDIDNFKRVNDTYGHENGNIVLVNLAETLRDVCGGCSQICRYGGEEFALIFPDSGEGETYDIINEARLQFAASEYHFMKNQKVTISCGIQQMSGEQLPRVLFEKADKAMYRAKRDGKNRCHIGSRERTRQEITGLRRIDSRLVDITEPAAGTCERAGE